MTGRQAATVAAILLAVLLVVGLILLRPMAPENYAAGDFSFEAVTGIRASAGVFSYDSTADTLAIDGEDEAMEELISRFEGKGFGRTFKSIFTQKPPISRVGDIYWTVAFTSAAGGSLTAEYNGGTLRLTGDGAAIVTAQDKRAWAEAVYEYIISLYPEPEPETPGTAENGGETQPAGASQ